MIVIYEKNETEFNNLGLGVLSPTKCTVSEELNGIYELELTHNFDEKGKYKYLENERIILANTPNGYQPFRIYRIVPTLDSIVVNARHIFYDLLNNFIINFNSNGTAKSILNNIKNAFSYPMNFNFETNINKNGNVILGKENPVSALLGTDEEKPKFIQVFGGEILRDKFNIKILENIGEDKGFTIRYGKNLLGLKIDEDYSSVVTRLYAYGENGINTIIDSENISNYLFPKISTQEFSGISDINTLRETATEYLKTVDIPIVNIEVNFVLLSQTKEYGNFKFLEDVKLGDILTIYNKKLNFSKKAKVISYTYNAINNSYEKIVLGDFLNNLTDNFKKNDNKINLTANKTNQLAIKKQSITDNNLLTKNKTVVGAINELLEKIGKIKEG